MFSLLSFKANGERLEHAGERPAFYALTYRGVVVDYFNTLQALQHAYAACLARVAELETERDTGMPVLKLAA